MARMHGAKGVDGNDRTCKTRKPSSSMFAMALEQRFMFDAAGAASIADVAQSEQAPTPTESQDTSTNQALADAAAHAVPPEARPADAVTQIASQISGAAADGAAATGLAARSYDDAQEGFVHVRAPEACRTLASYCYRAIQIACVLLAGVWDAVLEHIRQRQLSRADAAGRGDA